MACDHIVEEGGTVVLGEDFELIADIETLTRRGVNQQVQSDILRIRDDVVERYQKRTGGSIDWNDEKRRRIFQHAAKAGTKPVQKVTSAERCDTGTRICGLQRSEQ